jgi:hypothetical protein
VEVGKRRQRPAAALLDALHRYRLSLALGLSLIPAIQPSRDDGNCIECYRRILSSFTLNSASMYLIVVC